MSWRSPFSDHDGFWPANHLKPSHYRLSFQTKFAASSIPIWREQQPFSIQFHFCKERRGRRTIKNLSRALIKLTHTHTHTGIKCERSIRGKLEISIVFLSVSCSWSINLSCTQFSLTPKKSPMTDQLEATLTSCSLLIQQQDFVVHWWMFDGALDIEFSPGNKTTKR